MGIGPDIYPHLMAARARPWARSGINVRTIVRGLRTLIVGKNFNEISAIHNKWVSVCNGGTSTKKAWGDPLHVGRLFEMTSFQAVCQQRI